MKKLDTVSSTLRLFLKEKKMTQCQCYNCSLLLNSAEKGRLDSSIRFLEAVDLSHPVPV